MNTKQLSAAIEKGELDARLIALYGEENLAMQKARYLSAISSFDSLYGEREAGIYSVSGRSELSGNHTDHNHGCVVAASIDLDIIAIAAATDDGVIRVKSEGFGEDEVDIHAYTEPVADKFGSSASIIAGMCAGFRKNGHKVGGFCAYTTSSVLKGSGLSSSAAFEDMIGNILNHIYNDGAVDNVEIAMLAQYAENEFFGKPCGLMDQVACGFGGIVAIDFEDTSAPKIEAMNFDLTAAGYNLCIVNTGGNHADLTDDYASVPAEMKKVASFFGKNYLRELTIKEIIANAEALRKFCGDRAILRAIHFFNENQRVAAQKQALLDGDIQRFFENVKASGRSSFCYLQNVYTTKNVAEQGLSLALAIAEEFLADKSAAWRVHGGGFAGTIQAFVPTDIAKEFRAYMNQVFGDGACIILRIRNEGAIRLL